MVEGRIRKWMQDVVLLKQAYVKNPDQTVEQLVADTAKQVGSPIKVVAFARLALGEGVEKKADDFAAEVAAMTGGSLRGTHRASEGDFPELAGKRFFGTGVSSTHAARRMVRRSHIRLCATSR